MDFAYSPRTQVLLARLQDFMDEQIIPNETTYVAEIGAKTLHGARWTPLEFLEPLKQRARAAGLGNLFLPDSEFEAGLSNAEDAPLAEIMRRVPWCSEVFNCSAPDTGNMAVLAIQVQGGAGVSEGAPLAAFFSLARARRPADGPDEVDRNAIARIELGKAAEPSALSRP
jgi:alkylation response protein AidB-like acyl-CoA dehydrogenase